MQHLTMSMLSKLEWALVNDRLSKDNIRNTLFEYLDDGISLYLTRATSRTLRDSVDLVPARIWGALYAHAPWATDDKLFDFERISPSCRTLTIDVRISQPKDEHTGITLPSRKNAKAMWNRSNAVSTIKWLPSLDLGVYEMDRQLWTYAFKRCKSLENLILRVDGDPVSTDTAPFVGRCAFLSPLHLPGQSALLLSEPSHESLGR